MRAVVLSGPNQFAPAEIEKPQIGPDEILLEMKAAAICGTDMRILTGKKTKGVRYPSVIGHEFCGVIAEVGADVKGYEVGEKVAVANVIPCHHCSSCLRGRTNACLDRKAIGYDEYLTDYAEYRRMKPEELFELADQIQESASGYKTMEAWLLHMEEYGEQLKQQAQNRGERDLDCVALMTMHSSKGLEFPVVYIMDANERATPHHKAVLEADLEEERRMFYVAMTRAKDRLHVYYTKERYGKPQERSRFIDEYLYPDGAPPGEFRPGPQQNGAAGSYNRKAVR